MIRDRPFNLQVGVMVFCFVQKFFFRQHKSQNINFFGCAKCEIFFQNSTLGYMTKTLNQIIFFSSTKIRIFFSATLGIRIFSQKKTITPFKLNGRSLRSYSMQKCLPYLSRVTQGLPLVEQELLILPEFTPGFQWGLCYSIFSFLCNVLWIIWSFFFWPLCCLSSVDLRIPIIPFVSLNSSYQ